MSALGHKQTSAHVRVMSALPPKADISALLFARSHERARGSFLHPAQCLMPDTQSWKAVLTVVGAVYGGVNLSHLGSIPSWKYSLSGSH
jgi:hypothetical protein